jgi:hypothetical protein
MRFVQLITTLCVISTPVFSQTTLSGNIGGLTLEASGNPFLVTDNLTIPEGKMLIVKNGCVILFKAFTGLIVNGALSVEGTLEKPVVFTSEYDDRYNSQSKQLPNPFDWNGILISQKASNVKLSNFILEYSVYGVKSQKEEFIINNGTFSRNGQFHVTVGDQIKNVVEDIPFNFGKEPETDKKPIKTAAPGASHKPVAIVTGVTGAVSLGVSGLFFSRMLGYLKEYDASSQKSVQNAAMENAMTARNTGIVFAAAGAALVTTGIVIHVRDRRASTAKKVTINPILGINCGVAVSLAL